MKEVLAGAMVPMYAVVGLYFARFWRRTKDDLFAFFALAFWVLAVQQLALAITREESEHTTWFYLLRLLAFVLLLVGIIRKNRPNRPA